MSAWSPTSLARSMQRQAKLLMVLLSVAVVAAACAPQSGVEMSDQRAYVERLGADTISVEIYSRTAEGFQGDLLIRSPVTRVAHYEATLGAGGTVERMEVDWTTPPENPAGPGPFGFTYTRDADSARIVTRGGQNPGTTRLSVPEDAIPTVGRTPVAFAVLEQMLSQALSSGSDSFPISLVQARRGSVAPNAIVRQSADVVSMSFFGNPLLATFDEYGRISSRSGEHTTLKTEGEAVPDLDFASLAADFAARDARGEGMGVASPQATVEANAGGANLTIVYSQPAKRGREIWGGLVPHGEVWRTGANSATAFTTDRDLEIGGGLVPAGEYTLWSIYTLESAQLIINKQTGQWGTVYDEGQDLVRVDMTSGSVADVVERFTISVEPAENGGALVLSWDRTRFSVPIRVR